MNEKTTILCVDDEPINLMLFEINFSKKYHVIKANSGFEGLEKLKSNKEISVVVSDMKMPGMNGIEFISKAKHEFPNIFFIILTGFDITEEIMKALDEKLINKYFRKPFKMQEIDASILEALS